MDIGEWVLITVQLIWHFLSSFIKKGNELVLMSSVGVLATYILTETSERQGVQENIQLNSSSRKVLERRNV